MYKVDKLSNLPRSASMKARFDEGLLWWRSSLMKVCFDEGPLRWRSASMKALFDEGPLRWRSASMKVRFDEGSLRWRSASMKVRFDEGPLRWRSASMKVCFDEGLLQWRPASMKVCFDEGLLHHYFSVLWTDVAFKKIVSKFKPKKFYEIDSCLKVQWTTCNRAAHSRHQCRKITVLNCHRYLINTGVEKWTTFKYRLELWPPDVST